MRLFVFPIFDCFIMDGHPILWWISATPSSTTSTTQYMNAHLTMTPSKMGKTKILPFFPSKLKSPQYNTNHDIWLFEDLFFESSPICSNQKFQELTAWCRQWSTLWTFWIVDLDLLILWTPHSPTDSNFGLTGDTNFCFMNTKFRLFPSLC